MGEVGVGVVARTDDVDALLFCRLKGDCRPDSGVKALRDFEISVYVLIDPVKVHIPF